MGKASCPVATKHEKGPVMNTEKIEKLLDSMTVEDLCGQLLNYNIAPATPLEELDKQFRNTRPGGLFFGWNNTPERIAAVTALAEKYTKAPVIVSADIENGPGCCLAAELFLPQMMSLGAADDEALVERLGRRTAEICRESGIHWSFAPVVDINYNRDNPVTNIRAISDSPRQVAKIARAFVRGMQRDGLMVAGCKHFPGDGLDDRNQHFCTTINSLSKEEWMETYGYVYKEMFKENVGSVMVGHIAFPANEEEIDPILGPKPGTLSYNTMTRLLKGELGFEGCLISDAMSMVGTSVMCPPDRLSIEFIKNGGDMLLFPLERDYGYLMGAIESGEITLARLKDAVRRILVLKDKARLFEDKATVLTEIKSDRADLEAAAEELAEKSITLIRNAQNIIPMAPEKGAKFLIINMQRPGEFAMKYMNQADVLKQELEARGYVADMMSGVHVNHKSLEEKMPSYHCIIFACRINPMTYLGGTNRINWDNIMSFWRGVGVAHPRVVFVSLGDPYKLYELPFLRTYVNAYSADPATMRAFVKVLLGEIPAMGKSPVALKGFFDRETD